MKRRKKILSVQALRALAFICIFISHAFSQFMDMGAFGVSVFIVLSGFCMMYAYKDRELPTTLRERFLFSIGKMKKLYPLHIIMLIVSALFLLGGGVTLFKYLVLDTLLVQAWVPDAAFSLNGVAWYLSLSVFLYFMFPTLKTRIKAVKGAKNLMWAAAAIFVAQIWIGYAANMLAPGGLDVKWVTYIWPIYRLGDFAIGCILGELFNNTESKLSMAKASVLEILAVGAVVLSQVLILNGVAPFNTTWLRFTLIYTPISVALVYLFVVNKGVLSKILTNKLLVFIGNISGYAFLIHLVLLMYVVPWFLGLFQITVPKKVFALIAFAGTIVLSIIYAKVDELVRKRLTKQK